MRQSSKCNIIRVLVLFISLSVTTNLVAEDSTNSFKPNGISLTAYQHEVSLEVTTADFHIPGFPAGFVDSVKGQFDPLDDVQVVGLQLDREINSHINLFASVGRARNRTHVELSQLPLGTTDMTFTNKGVVYNLGTTLHHRFGSWITSLSYVYSQYDMDGQKEAIVTDTLSPLLGMLTKIGMLNLYVVHQDSKYKYQGIVSLPEIGNVPVTMTAKNKDSTQLFGGYLTRLAKDLYFTANLSLNGDERLQLVLNKRF